MICQHCGGALVIPLTAAWPEQCPHCRVWNPRLGNTAPGAMTAAKYDDLTKRGLFPHLLSAPEEPT